MSVSRRTFIRLAAATGAAAGFVRSPLHAFALPDGNPLRIPSPLSGTTLTAAITQGEVWPGSTTELFTINGSYPSPTIRVRRGQELNLQLVNNLEETTIIHWHGLLVPHHADGHPMDAIEPGETYDYSFTVDQQAATCWYHPHPHGRTGPQVYKGMAGLFIIDDDESDALDLPSGDHDVPLVIQDRRAEDIPEFTYEPAMPENHAGYLGDVMLANGTPEAYHEVSATLYRLRILNGCNARILNVGLSDGSPMQVIGVDGGLLDKPYEVPSVRITPAERVELLVDFSRYEPGESVVLRTLGFPPRGFYEQGVEMDVVRFDITATDDEVPPVPSALVNIQKLDESAAARTRTIRFTTGAGGVFLMNGLQYDMSTAAEVVPLGDMEVWEFQNLTQLAHPMHIHAAQFQVLSRSSQPTLPPSDFGWKDTVHVGSFDVVKVLVRFAPYVGRFLFHCHNLEHEDHGMMLNYDIDEITSVERAVKIGAKMDLR